MPTLVQRAETFVINARNPIARELVRELRAEVLRLERELAKVRAAAEPHVRPPGSD